MRNNPALLAYKLFWQVIDWVYPPQCAGCGVIGVSWCERCAITTPELPDHVCNVCSEPLSGELVCTKCKNDHPSYKQLRSWRVYSGPIKEAIHSLKYDRNVGAGLALANHLMGMYDQSGWHVDMIIPVPISHERFRERGYNQTSLLAYPLALYARIPYKPKALHRLKNTPTQTGLSARERQENLLGAFIANPLIVSKANILIVDDVATTGSTLEACSQALVNAGARDVYCFTLAKTLLTNPQMGSVYQQTVIPT